MKNKKPKTEEYGFSLIEMIVVIFTFLMVIGMGTGIFTLATRGQRKAIAFQDSIDNARFALEEMSRGIRVSTIITSTASTISICHPTIGYEVPECETGLGIDYRYDPSSKRIEKNIASLPNYLPMTSGDVTITGFNFNTSGLASDDNTQPRVTITLGAQSADAGPNPETINLQITLSPRPLDVP